MMSVILSLLVLAGLSVRADNNHVDDFSPNPFDKFFPDLTTVKQKADFVYKMYQFKNHPTQMTMPPPPRGARRATSTSTSTEPPDDREGDFKIIPVEKPPTNGNPFLTKDGFKKRKVNKREVRFWIDRQNKLPVIVSL